MLRTSAILLARKSRAAAELASQGLRGMAETAGKEIKLPPQYGIPGRYAAALYMAAVKGNQLDKVEKELTQISKLMADSKEFNEFVSDPSIPSQSRVEGLNAVLKKMGASDITKRFFDVVLENNRVNEIERIFEKFGDISAQQKGQVKAVVTTAEGLGRAEVEQIQTGLKKILNPGQSLVLEEKVDPTIIAGIILDIEDKHVDMSVLSRVRKLQQIVRDAV